MCKIEQEKEAQVIIVRIKAQEEIESQQNYGHQEVTANN